MASSKIRSLQSTQYCIAYSAYYRPLSGYCPDTPPSYCSYYAFTEPNANCPGGYASSYYTYNDALLYVDLYYGTSGATTGGLTASITIPIGVVIVIIIVVVLYIRRRR